jgi:hypothetical protein
MSSIYVYAAQICVVLKKVTHELKDYMNIVI